jgi:hypothetical protein
MRAAAAFALAVSLAAAACSAPARSFPGPPARAPSRAAGSPAAGSPAAGSPAATRGSGAGQPPGRLAYRYMTDISDGRVTAAYGYNLVDVGPYRSAIDALPADQRALVWIGDYDKASCAFERSDANVRQALAGLAGDPKVVGYYIADEPDDALPAYGGRCPAVAAQVAARSRLVHALAPGAFTYEVVTEPGNFAAFARATDVLGADPYPCRVGRPCDWTMIPRYIAALGAAHVARYWGLLQAFAQPPWRYPTPAELGKMITQWQRSDWAGEQTFAWNFGGHSLASQPGLLSVLAALNRGG